VDLGFRRRRGTFEEIEVAAWSEFLGFRIFFRYSIRSGRRYALLDEFFRIGTLEIAFSCKSAR